MMKSKAITVSSLFLVKAEPDEKTGNRKKRCLRHSSHLHVNHKIVCGQVSGSLYLEVQHVQHPSSFGAKIFQAGSLL